MALIKLFMASAPDVQIVTNARNHLGRRYVLNVDLEDFFPSIIRRRIYGRLIAEPYALDSGVAHLISNLSTNAYGRLPQGSPSSPIIANIIASKMDTDLANLCSSLYCRYTRYADDITISTSRSVLSPHIARYPNALGTGQVIIGDRLTGIIENNGFKLNHRKSRLQSNWTRQLCTGLVVNDGDFCLSSEVLHTPLEIIGSSLEEERLARRCQCAAYERESGP